MKIVLVSCFILVILFGNEGKLLFDKHCISCHIPFISMSKIKENFLDHNNTQLKMTAPTLNQLSYRLKQRIGDPKGDEEMHRLEVTVFMADYVMYPDRDKSVCLDDVMQHFKTMPSLKGKVTEEELEDIGTYLYDFDKNIVKEKGLKYEGFNEALNLAKKEHKIIMIKVMTKECYYCRKMEREVMIDDEIIEAIKKDFIPVSIDISTHSLPLGLKAVVTPTFIFIDENAKVLLNIPGAWGKGDFMELLKEAKITRQRKDEK